MTAWNWPPSINGVTTFNGRRGAVVPTLGDYPTSLITNDSLVSGATAKAVLDKLGRRGALWLPPNTPHANDQEFDSGVAPAGWTMWTDGAPFTVQPIGSTITPFTSAGANPQVAYNKRSSHVSIQLPYDGHIYYYLNDLGALPTNAFFWTCISTNRRSTANALTGGDNRMSLSLLAKTAGAPTTADFVTLEFQHNNLAPVLGSGQDFMYRFGGANGGVSVGGSNTVQYTTAYDVQSSLPLYPYFGVQKLGTTYHGLLADDHGNKAYLGSVVVAGALSYVGYRMQENTAPPTTFFPTRDIDFYRQIDTAEGFFGLGQ